MRNRLIQKAHTVTNRSVSSTRDQGQRLVLDIGMFKGCDAFVMGGQFIGLNPAQIKTLATRQNGDRNFADFGGRKDEFHMLWRFFQRFQKRVERTFRQHVHFVDDVNLVARRCRAITDAFDQFANIVNTRA